MERENIKGRKRTCNAHAHNTRTHNEHSHKIRTHNAHTHTHTQRVQKQK